VDEPISKWELLFFRFVEVVLVVGVVGVLFVEVWMRVCIYARVSTDEQFVYKQESELRDFAVGKGLIVVKVYKDVISGSRDSRPELNKLMLAAYNGEFDSVLIWKLEMAGRSLKHLIDIVRVSILWHVNLICKIFHIYTTTLNGKLLFHIFGAVAKFERTLNLSV